MSKQFIAAMGLRCAIPRPWRLPQLIGYAVDGNRLRFDCGFDHPHLFARAKVSDRRRRQPIGDEDVNVAEVTDAS